MSNTGEPVKEVTAAVILIGDEILSGRTQDLNLAYISTWLNVRGIQVHEARVIPDDEDVIAHTVNELRAKCNYVFTTGGIGPTHDDITADSIAKAFGVKIDYHPEVLRMLAEHYKEGEFTEARKRMARIPEGGTLVPNPISRAPGFQVENVFVMAGIPRIMQAQLEGVADRIVGGFTVISRTITVRMAEGNVAEKLTAVQERFADVSIGSYPSFHADGPAAALVMRARDEDMLDEAADAIRQMIRDLGAEPIEGEVS